MLTDGGEELGVLSLFAFPAQITTKTRLEEQGRCSALLSFAQLCSRPTLLVCKGLIDGQGLQAPGHLHPTLESDV